MIKIAKYCPNCGAPIEAHSKLCEICGTPIEQPQQSRPIYTQPPQEYVQPQSNYNQVYADTNYPNRDVSQKSQGILIILWFFGGWLGLHQFYAGKIGMRLLYFCTLGLLGIGWLIDICAVVGGTFTDEFGRPITN